MAKFTNDILRQPHLKDGVVTGPTLLQKADDPPAPAGDDPGGTQPNKNPQETGPAPTTAVQQETGPAPTTAVQQESTAVKPYDPAADTAYRQALGALQQAQANMPTYAGTYDAQLKALYGQIVGREGFTYDLNEDTLYQMYKDQYVNQGRMAMLDTMGQAAALTGGYSNSYAQAAGQQAYQTYLQQLNAVAPELYSMAWERYNQQGQDLLNRYSMLGGLASDEYGKYQDSLSQYWQNVSYLDSQADDAYDRGLAQNQLSYDRQQDAYSRLLGLITTTGYSPSQQELAAAGMTQSEAQSWMDHYTAQNTPRYTGSSKKSSLSASEYEKWSQMFRYAGSTSELKALRNNMISAGVSESIADELYNLSMEQLDDGIGPTAQSQLYTYVKNILDNATGSAFDPERVIRGRSDLSSQEKAYALEVLDAFVAAGYTR